MTDFINEAERIAPELAALRRAFHMDPELGNREYHTAARIEDARILPVSTANSRQLAASRTSVLLVLAPMMPSLNAPVIWELVLRTSR